MYEYNAQVLQVIDADTLLISLDLGFDVHLKQRLRIRDLHAPERFTDSGKTVTAFVKTLLDTDRTCIVQTKKTTSGEERDKYGRYVASVILPDGRDFRTTVTAFMDSEGITDRGR